MPDFYSRDGKPLTMERWAKYYESLNRVVGQTHLSNGYWVSTVYLGLDHSLNGGPPLIFETMVFPEGSYQEQDMERYSTDAQAKAGHRAMCKKWKTKKLEVPK